MKQARGEAARCVDTLTFSAVEARSLAGEVVPMESSAAGAGKLGIILREPVGVVGGDLPVQLPAQPGGPQAGPGDRRRLPGRAEAGLRHPPVGARCWRARWPRPGCRTGSCRWSSAAAGRWATRSSTTRTSPMISFTGSPPVGWGIRQRQPRKHVALELGNSTPVIVEPDADLEAAARKLAGSGFTHAGQSCISVQRVYVHEAAIAEFRDLFAAAVEGLVVGRPDGRRDRRRPGDRRRATATASWSGSARREAGGRRDPDRRRAARRRPDRARPSSRTSTRP